MKKLFVSTVGLLLLVLTSFAFLVFRRSQSVDTDERLR
jgi:hypothetical protein